jgi:hypothetical protein
MSDMWPFEPTENSIPNTDVPLRGAIRAVDERVRADAMWHKFHPPFPGLLLDHIGLLHRYSLFVCADRSKQLNFRIGIAIFGGLWNVWRCQSY